MAAYYNEFDPLAAAWSRELIKQNLIAQGDVDDRSITEVKAEELRRYTQCHFFAGIGVWSYALRQAGWPDDRPVWTGSCPCQPFSSAGRQKGFQDERHLWPVWFRLIRESNPHCIFGEQVAKKAGIAWLDLVSTDLQSHNFKFGAAITSAASFGAPHIRQRIYFCGLANTAFARLEGTIGQGLEGASGRPSDGRPSGRELATKPERNSFWTRADWLSFKDGKRRPTEPGSFPLVNGAPARVGRLRGYGNGLCAPQAQAFIESFLEATASWCPAPGPGKVDNPT